MYDTMENPTNSYVKFVYTILGWKVGWLRGCTERIRSPMQASWGRKARPAEGGEGGGQTIPTET